MSTQAVPVWEESWLAVVDQGTEQTQNVQSINNNNQAVRNGQFKVPVAFRPLGTQDQAVAIQRVLKLAQLVSFVYSMSVLKINVLCCC